MARHFLWRGVFAVVVLLLVTVVAFFIIELPPGDYVTDLVARLRSAGAQVTVEMEAALRHQYGVDRPVYVRYLLWMGKMIRGEMGLSYEWRRPVRDLIVERLPMSITSSATACATPRTPTSNGRAAHVPSRCHTPSAWSSAGIPVLA